MILASGPDLRWTDAVGWKRDALEGTAGEDGLARVDFIGVPSFSAGTGEYSTERSRLA